MYFIHYNLKSIPHEFSTFETLPHVAVAVTDLTFSLPHGVFHFDSYTCTVFFCVCVLKHVRLLKSFLVFIIFFASFIHVFFFPLYTFFLLLFESMSSEGGMGFYLACACDIIHTYFTLLLLSLVRCVLFVFYSHIHSHPPSSTLSFSFFRSSALLTSKKRLFCNFSFSSLHNFETKCIMCVCACAFFFLSVLLVSFIFSTHNFGLSFTFLKQSNSKRETCVLN